jgi:hypothetical protein
MRVGNFIIPSSDKSYRLPIDPAGSSAPRTRRELLIHVAALYTNTDGRVIATVIPDLVASFTLHQQDELFILGFLADLRVLVFIQRSDVSGWPLQVVAQRAAGKTA